MNTRQVLLGAVVVGIVGGLMALPWVLCMKSRSAGPKSDRADSAGTFRYDGKTLEQWQSSWQKELKAERKIEVFRAMTAFGTHGCGKEAAGTVINVVRAHCRELGANAPFDDRDRFFNEAHAALALIGPPSSLALLECLQDPDRNVSQFGRTVSRMELHPSAVPLLVKLADGDNQEWSALALQTLGNNLQKTPPPAEIETALIETVKKGKHAKSFLETLQRNLRGDKMNRPAVAILRTLGPNAHLAVGTLLDALQRELQRADRRHVAPPGVSGRESGVRNQGSAGQLADCRLLTPDCCDLCLMMDALGRIQGEPDRVVPVLAGVAGNRLQEYGVRRCAAKTLSQFGPQAASATAMMLEALDDSIRCDALEALGKLQADPGRVVPRLVQALNKEMDESAHGTRAPGAAVPSLVSVGQVSPLTASFVKASLDYLGTAGPEARNAVPVLVRIHRQVEEVRPQVAAVLEKIEPTALQEAQRLGVEQRSAPSDSLSSPRPDLEIRPAAFSSADPAWQPADQESRGNVEIPRYVPSRDVPTTPAMPAPMANPPMGRLPSEDPGRQQVPAPPAPMADPYIPPVPAPPAPPSQDFGAPRVAPPLNPSVPSAPAAPGFRGLIPPELTPSPNRQSIPQYPDVLPPPPPG